MKFFYRMDNIGTVKYTINYYDGESKHSDGSDFFNIKTFNNKKVMNTFIKSLKFKGYKEV